jgi:hypothetical protein
VETTGRRPLLPEAARASVVLIDVACVGSAALAWVGGYTSPELVIGLGATFAAVSLLALLPGPRRAPAARTVAAVLTASPPPVDRILGRCTMILRLNDSDGSPRQFVFVDAHTPTAAWPTEGSRVIVEITKGRTPKVEVLWHLGVSYPEVIVDEHGFPAPVRAIEEADLRALPPLERVEVIAALQPSTRTRRYLFPTEKFRGEWRRHWVRWFKELAVGFVLALVTITGYHAEVGRLVVDVREVMYAALVSQGVWVAWVIWRGLTWLKTKLVLTNKRVLLVNGLFRRRVASVPLTKVADILHTKSPLGIVLGYGTVRFTNVPVLRPLWRMADLPRPTELYLRIVEETFEPEAAEARRRLVVPADDGATTLDELLATQATG